MDICDECHMPWPRPAGEKNICPKCFWLLKDSGKPKKHRVRVNRSPESADAPLREDLSQERSKGIRDPSLLSESDKAEPKE